MRKPFTDREKEIAYLEIEESRIEREKAQTVLNKGFMIYLSFLLIGIVGFVSDYITSSLLNLFVIMGLLILVVSTMPYLTAISREEKVIKNLLKELRK
ncbi:MAG: hypothetical protein KJ601_05460 [Nanoarchaeota archaeon]|nr:hypothetical protein [Nanoarchaeota archaeon]MBU1704359.1 hypothetical protein [Nanoarchaeota archaeon]